VGLVRRHPVRSAAGFVALLAVTLVLASFVVVWRAAHHDDASEVDHVDAIVVLGAAQYNGTPSPVFRGRLEHALRLWNQGRADRIFVLGAKQPGDRTTEAASGRDFLVSNGVPSGAVEAIAVGHTSFESLRAAAQTMLRSGMESAFLVSDPWHNARIKRMAGDLGIRGYASATWTSAAKTEETRFEGYVRETLAYLYYRVSGH
jgi:vancomycin permeability regulator SanA